MNRLKELREDKDLYQKDIANYLKIDQSNYSKYELEKVNIPVDYLRLLADYYNTSIDYILYRTDERKPFTSSQSSTSTSNPGPPFPGSDGTS